MTNTSKNTAEPQVTITMPAATAHIVVEALDFYSRMGLGQLDEIVSMARFGLLKNAKGEQPTMDQLEDAERHINAAKQAMFGYPSNASHGIFSDKVAPRFRTVWGVLKAVRHRLAWDRTPQGGIQTSFDEPMREESAIGVTVSSAATLDILDDLPADLMVLKHGNDWGVARVHPDVKGAPLQLLGRSSSLQTAIQKAKNTLDRQ